MQSYPDEIPWPVKISAYDACQMELAKRRAEAERQMPIEPPLDPEFTFGKYKGVKLSEVPYGYVYWLLVDKNTSIPYKRGNYEWIKEAQPHMFKALKERMRLMIDAL